MFKILKKLNAFQQSLLAAFSCCHCLPLNVWQSTRRQKKAFGYYQAVVSFDDYFILYQKSYGESHTKSSNTKRTILGCSLRKSRYFEFATFLIVLDDVFLRVPEERGKDVVWIDTTYRYGSNS